MGTRYVWGKYTAVKNQVIKTGFEEVKGDPKPISVAFLKDSTEEYIFISRSISINQETGQITLVDQTKYTWVQLSAGISGYIDDTGTIYYAEHWTGGTDGHTAESDSASQVTSKEYSYTENYYTQGKFVNWESAQNRSSKPDGYKGGYYYTYQGQDILDPKAVTIPSSIRGGNTIEIHIDPSDQKKYDGTVSYQIQYSLDGGNWTTVATTTAENCNIKVPNSISTIQARAKAGDDIGFESETWVLSQKVDIVQNLPPTAPESIEVENVEAGKRVTIKITAATDPDGSVSKYIFERQVDGGEWEEVETTESLSASDKVDANWGTITWRACAVDNEETKGPYIESKTFVVNTDLILISGPGSDLGDHLNRFHISVAVSIATEEDVLDQSIHVEISMDHFQAEKLTVQSGETIQINIDTRYMNTGKHTLKIHAEKEGFMAANANYIVNIPPVSMEILERAEEIINQDDKGRVQCPVTFARSVYGPDGKDVYTMVLEGLQITAGSYTGSGSAGKDSANELTLPFEPTLVCIFRQDGTKLVQLAAVNADAENTFGGITFSPKETGISWYAEDAAAQMNESEVPYGYYAIGNWKQKEAT